MMHYVYFIKSEVDESVYVGITKNIEVRLQQHNNGKTRSTKSKAPYKLIYFEAYTNKRLARIREIELKGSWQAKKEVLDRLQKAN